MGGTGTIQVAKTQVIRNMKSDALQIEFTNDNGGTLYEGQEVYIKSNGKVAKRTTGAQIPVGIVLKKADDAARVLVRTYFTLTMTNKAKGATVVAGTFVVQDGTVDASEFPNVVTAASGEISSLLCYKGGAVAEEVRVGVVSGYVTI